MDAGTLQVGGVTQTSCSLVEGQCSCSIPGIVGRTCDRCAEGTTSKIKPHFFLFVGLHFTLKFCKLLRILRMYNKLINFVFQKHTNTLEQYQLVSSVFDHIFFIFICWFCHGG